MTGKKISEDRNIAEFSNAIGNTSFKVTGNLTGNVQKNNAQRTQRKDPLYKNSAPLRVYL